MRNRKRSNPGNEKVGYGRPPRATQFKPGKSGNPQGRPKGSRPVGSLLQKIIQQKVPVTENGKTRRLTALEVMLRRLANDAMRNDQKAVKLLLSLVDRYSDSAQTHVRLHDMLAEDEAILAEYLKDPGGFAADAPGDKKKGAKQ